jgi:hypothetical protein
LALRGPGITEENDAVQYPFAELQNARVVGPNPSQSWGTGWGTGAPMRRQIIVTSRYYVETWSEGPGALNHRLSEGMIVLGELIEDVRSDRHRGLMSGMLQIPVHRVHVVEHGNETEAAGAGNGGPNPR